MRQIAGVFASLRKRGWSASSKAARDRKRATGVKVESRNSYREIDEKHGGEMIAMVKRLRRKAPKGHRRSLRAIADELARAGYKSESGKPYAATGNRANATRTQLAAPPYERPS